MPLAPPVTTTTLSLISMLPPLCVAQYGHPAAARKPPRRQVSEPVAGVARAAKGEACT
jgi:hypothetical protein